MEYGRFFAVNQTSRPEHKEVRFEYTAFRSKIGKKYPVYLVFQDDHINFYFNGYVKHEDAERYQLVETKLFSLHLHNDKQTQKELEKELVKLYSVEFPFKKEYEVISANKKGNNSNNEIKNYKNLKVFSPDNKTNKIFYKNLILDFLQDFNHTDVFDHCPQFSKIKHLIKESPFLYAIANKARYYFLIENYNKNKIYNLKENYYTKQLIKAQDDYLSILQNENNYHFLKKENNWFEDAETETRKVLDATKTIENTNYKNIKDNEVKVKKKFSNNKFKALEWFIGRNNIYRAWTIHPKFKRLFFTFGSIILLFIILFSFDILAHWHINYYTIIFLFLIKLFHDFISFSPCIEHEEVNEQKETNLRNFIFNKFTKFLKYFVKLINIPLIFLLIGSSFLVFEISSFYNNVYIHNNVSFLFGLLLILLLTFIFIYKFFKHNDYNDDCLFKKHWKNALILTISLFIIGCYNLNQYIFSANLTVLSIIFVLIFLSIYGILFYNDRENHPNLAKKVTRHKTFSMLFYGLVISLFVNTLMYNGYYKEFLEKYNYLGEMWEEAHYKEDNLKNELKNLHKTKNEENEEKKNHSLIKTKHNSELEFIYIGNELDEIKQKAKEPLSDEVSVYIDNHFYPELKNLYVAKKIRNKPVLLFPVLKEIELPLGIKLIVMPSVLFINTFLSLLVAVILQILFHKRKFLLGGEAE